MKRIAFFTVIIMIFAACSSAPKNPGDVFDLRNQAEDGLKTSNKIAGQGNFPRALKLLPEYKNFAILADDSSLIIRISLSLGNVYFSLGDEDKAYAEWEIAAAEAERLNDAELISVCRVFKARGDLFSGRETAQKVLDTVNNESNNIKKDQLYIAFSHQVRGLSLRALGSYTEAEAAVRRSLDIHLKDRYLENASYDWYIIASIRSLKGDEENALGALNESIAIDRRIENSWGLAFSYRAMGDVYRKMNRETDALASYRRSKDIFTAMKNDHEAQEVEDRMTVKSN